MNIREISIFVFCLCLMLGIGKAIPMLGTTLASIHPFAVVVVWLAIFAFIVGKPSKRRAAQ